MLSKKKPPLQLLSITSFKGGFRISSGRCGNCSIKMGRGADTPNSPDISSKKNFVFERSKLQIW